MESEKVSEFKEELRGAKAVREERRLGREAASEEK